MLIIGLDVATSTGIAWVDRSKPPSQWRCLAVESEGDNAEEKAGDLGLYLFAELAVSRPAFAAIEMPQRSVKQFGKKVRNPQTGKEEVQQTINPNALQLSGLAGAVVAALDIRQVPWGLLAPATWRSAYYGKGVAPDETAGQDWKDVAIEYARQSKILLPPTVKAQRDAAEAVGIAVAWQKCTFVPKRHQAAFMALRAGRMAA